jgi:hypothetical protein
VQSVMTAGAVAVVEPDACELVCRLGWYVMKLLISSLSLSLLLHCSPNTDGNKKNTLRTISSIYAFPGRFLQSSPSGRLSVGVTCLNRNDPSQSTRQKGRHHG